MSSTRSRGDVMITCGRISPSRYCTATAALIDSELRFALGLLSTLRVLVIDSEYVLVIQARALRLGLGGRATSQILRVNYSLSLVIQIKGTIYAASSKAYNLGAQGRAAPTSHDEAASALASLP
jgi:hypothetical protein